MVAKCFRGPITAAPTNEQFFREKCMSAKFQIDISKPEGRHKHGQIDWARPVII